MAILAGYVHILLVARLISADAVGELAISFAVVNIGSTLSRFGVDNALIRLGSVGFDQSGWPGLRHLAKLAVAVSCTGAAFAGALLLVLSRVEWTPLAGSASIDAIRIAAFGIAPMSAIAVLASVLRCVGAVSVQSVVRLGIAPTVAAIWFGFSDGVLGRDVGASQAYVESLYGSLVLGVIVSMAILGRSQHAKRDRAQPAVFTLPGFLRVAYPMLLASGGFVLLQWIDTLMLDGAVPKAAVGGYSVAMRLGSAIEVPLVIAATVVNAEFAKQFQLGNIGRIRRLAQSSAVAAAAISFPLAMPLLIAPRAILGVFDPAFEDAAVALVLLVGVRLVSVTCGAVVGVLTMTDSQDIIQWALGAAVVTNVVLNAILIPRYGVNGAAIAQAVAILIWNGIAAFTVRHRLGIWAGASWAPISELVDRRRGV